MILSEIKKIQIPSGVIVKITDSKGILWGQKQEQPSIIPNEYQQVEYLATDGSQIIDTGVIPSEYADGIHYILDFKQNWTSSLNSNDYVWGSISGTSRSGNLYYNRGAGNARVICGTSSSGITYNWYDLSKRCLVKVFATSENANATSLEYEKDGVTVIPTINSSTFANATMPSESIYLFNCRAISRQGTPIVCYGFAMKGMNGKEIRNFVPCYRKSDNVIGLYDTVTQTFFTNIGTGAFTKGADV